MSPSILFAFWTLLEMCLLNLRSSWNIIPKSRSSFIVGHPEPEKKFCWHFWVHFGIHAKSVS